MQLEELKIKCRVQSFLTMLNWNIKNNLNSTDKRIHSKVWAVLNMENPTENPINSITNKNNVSEKATMSSVLKLSKFAWESTGRHALTLSF